MFTYDVLVASRIVTVWMCCAVAVLTYINHDNTEDYYRMGPHDDFVLLGCTIDTWAKYSIVVLYCFMNTLFRNVQNNVIHPFIVLNIQDNSIEGVENKRLLCHRLAYEISVMSAVYYWFDWFIYMHMLLVQIDMIFVEVLTDIIITFVITYFYLVPHIGLNKPLNERNNLTASSLNHNYMSI